ncbi:MAG: GntR family transcriptional regulator [Acidimicrobiales bacterium]|nr:GntR family transcriptional regulator [Acidimicrobiales bacterium]RZV43426.1 MAG: GntR family transcriptional regulator [Acidimicrobiales bacterium]
MSDANTPPDAAEPETKSEQAYGLLRDMIVRLDFAPGDVLREDELQDSLKLGRTPIREALQRLEREHFVTVIPRRGMYVTGIDVSELSMLFETRTVLEPYAARLAAVRGVDADWDTMEAALAGTGSGVSKVEHLAVDRVCHEIMWRASGNRFLWDTLDMLYAQSDRLWHLYLADVADMEDAVVEHQAILAALRAGDADTSASLVEAHVQSFDTQVRAAVTAGLEAPLAQ